MPLRDSEAVVLRSFPLGEADRLVSLLCRSVGRIRGVARGARRPKSRFGSTLETLSHIQVWFYERETRELVRINQCELLESFLDVQRDYERGLALALLSEITEAVLPEREPSDAAFRLLLHTAQALKKGGDLDLCVAYFCLWTVRLAGWLPSLEAEKPGRRPSGMSRVSAKSLAVARRMLEQRLDTLLELKEPTGRLEDLQDFLMDTIEQQIERSLSARRLLNLARVGHREPIQ